MSFVFRVLHELQSYMYVPKRIKTQDGSGDVEGERQKRLLNDEHPTFIYDCVVVSVPWK